MITTNYIGDRHTAGVGYVIIPTDVDRDKFIQYCYNTSTVSIALENGGALHNMQCGSHIFDHIQFPKNNTELGSMVVWVDQPVQNYPVVVAILPKADETINLKENQTSINRTTSKGSCEVLVDGNDPMIIVNCDSITESGGDIYILSKNKTQSSKINIKSSGEINIATRSFNANISDDLNINILDPSVNDKQTVIRYKNGEGFEYLDEFENNIKISDGKIDIVSKNINIGGDNAKQPILLGDDTISMIDKILEILGRTTTTTLIGAQPILTAPEFIALRSQLEILKSKKHKVE